MGAAGASGGIKSSAFTVTGGSINFADRTPSFAFNPSDGRFGFVLYGGGAVRVIVFNANGTTQFGYEYYLFNATTQRFTSCCFDSSGNFYATGFCNETGRHIPIFKLDSSGTRLLNTGSYFSGEGRAIATDGTNLYISGGTGGRNGQMRISKQSASTGAPLISRIGSNSSNHEFPTTKLVLKGSSLYSFGAGLQTSNQNSYMFLAKFDTSLNVEWSRYINAGGSYGEFQGGDVDSSGNVYATGWDNFVPYLFKINSSGTYQWHFSGTQYATEFIDAVVDESTGDVYVVGSIQLNSRYAILLFKVTSSGTVEWQRSFQRYQTSNGWVVDFQEINIKIDSDKVLRIGAKAYDSVQGIRTMHLITYNPVTKPTGTFNDPFNYGVSYQWIVSSASATLNFSNSGFQFVTSENLIMSTNTLVNTNGNINLYENPFSLTIAGTTNF